MQRFDLWTSRGSLGAPFPRPNSSFLLFILILELVTGGRRPGRVIMEWNKECQVVGSLPALEHQSRSNFPYFVNSGRRLMRGCCHTHTTNNSCPVTSFALVYKPLAIETRQSNLLPQFARLTRKNVSLRQDPSRNEFATSPFSLSLSLSLSLSAASFVNA
jgi:hypothetical protein